MFKQLVSKQQQLAILQHAAATIADPQHYVAQCQGFHMAWRADGKPCKPEKACRFTLIAALQLAYRNVFTGTNLAHGTDVVSWHYLLETLDAAYGQRITADNVTLPHACAMELLAKAQYML